MGDELAACRSAAPVCLRQFDEFDPLDHLEQLAWLFPYPLPAPQVTGVVVRDPGLDAPFRLFQWEFHQELADIPYPGAEGIRPAGPIGIIHQQPVVVLERGTAGGA